MNAGEVFNQTERNALVTSNKVYAGIIVYVTGENKYYYYSTGNQWIEFGSLQDLVYTSGNQTISGIKSFTTRPTVNGTGVLLSGEAAQVDLSSTVRITGDQTISGIKTFQQEIVGSNDFLFEMPLQDLGNSPARGLKLVGGNFTGSKYFGEHVFISGGRGNMIGGHVVLQGGGGAVLSGEVAGWGDFFRFNGVPIIDMFGRVIAPDVFTNRNDIIVNRNVFSIRNTGRGTQIFGGQIVLSGGSALSGGGTPNIGGPIRFIGGSGGQGISGFFDFLGESIIFNNNSFLVQKEGDITCRSLYASTGSSVPLNSGEIKCLSFSCAQRPIVDGTGVILSGEAVPPFVDINNIITNFNFSGSYNSKLLTINASQNITGTVPTGLSTGYNVAFVQMGAGQLRITGQNGVTIRQRLNLYNTAGQYAIASLVHRENNEYILYGDLA
jgi:hypothetical protein